MRWHVLSRVAMATNRGVKVVDKEITHYYKDVDFTKWIGKKVFVGADRKFNNITISIRNK
jgi:CYTH domain-containing protein